jgi:hypothetical protein
VRGGVAWPVMGDDDGREQVGFITDMITSKMEEVSSGMSKVVESNHVVILGWNSSTLRLVSQIGLAKMDYKDSLSWYHGWLWPKPDVPNALCKGATVILAEGIDKVRSVSPPS